VLEPEAASIYCFSRFKEPTFGGKNTMIVDCGGGTVDLIVHANDASDGSVKLRELSKGSGDLCGGTFVDDAFLDAMARRIPGFDAYRQAEPAELLRGLMAKWELLKRSFDGTTDAILDLPPKLARALDKAKAEASGYDEEDDEDAYGRLTLSAADVRGIFEPVLVKIMSLIDAQNAEAADRGGIDCLFLVGGFADSPYLSAKARWPFAAHLSADIASEGPRAVCGQDPLHPQARLSRQFGAGGRRAIRPGAGGGGHPPRAPHVWLLDGGAVVAQRSRRQPMREAVV